MKFKCNSIFDGIMAAWLGADRDLVVHYHRSGLQSEEVETEPKISQRCGCEVLSVAD